ncbi:unnamed protein product [Rotaria sp. Silwood1]|nr:unnamed protein product [Rotaria sp. Silwood1]CAF0900616.1 unnamed protein product [Rotaria sp. Silwood1]
MTHSQKPRVNVELPRALWLVSSEYNTTSQGAILRDQIEDIFGNIHVKENIKDCEKFIRDKHGNPQYEQIFFIIHIDFFHQILNQDIHDIRVIESIFIFNPTKFNINISFEQYSKVHRKIFIDPKDLLIELSNNVSIFSEKWRIPLSTLKGCHMGRTTNVVNNIADYSELWYPLFIDLLFDLPLSTDFTYQEHRNHFANQCQRFYAHSPRHLVEIADFISSSNSSYTPNCAINYYTRDTFLYKRVNKALRQQNIEAIFAFHFLLLDIRAQLLNAYNEFSSLYEIGDIMTFYRGQLLFKYEIDALNEKRRDGSLITVNSYFSTTIIRNVALTYIKGAPNDSLIPVMIEISAEFKTSAKVCRKPFAYIGHLSAYRSAEYEVLFSIGSFFRIDHIEFNDNDQLWTVKMTFIFDEDHYTVTNDYNALQTCTIEEKIIKVGNLLSHHNEQCKTNKANIFYQHLLTHSFNQTIKAACHVGLGWLTLQQKQYDIAIDYVEQALNICKQLGNDSYLNYLYVISYCCIGAIYRQKKDYTNALEFHMKAYKIDNKIISIDKYAFYNSFVHIASINIASLYKLTNRINLSWAMFKDILTYETNKSNQFHSAIYLAIAEAGFTDIINSKNISEEIKWSNNWKAFFDLSFHEISSTYRQCIISGALSIGFKFRNNERSYDNAIICFEKVIQISKKYLKICPDYYGNILQCYQQLAQIYRLKHKYLMAINCASEILKVCHVDDFKAIYDCYTSLVDIYEEQYKEICSTPSPDDIHLKLCDSDLSLPPFQFKIVENMFQFERDEFAFGQFKKGLNPNIIHEKKLERRLAYFCFKLAALNQEQNNKIKANQLLHRSIELIPNDINVQFIFKTNLNYLEGNFGQIINFYQSDLEQCHKQDQELCIGEDAFCYIAHLYKMENNLIEEYNWYIDAIYYFEEHPHLCKHTRTCFFKLAFYYRTKHDLTSCISIYRRFIHYLLVYSNNTCKFHRSIVNIIELSFEKMINDEKRIITILEYLVQLVTKKSNDLIHIDEEFQKMIAQYRGNNKYLHITAQIYEFYVEFMSQNVNLTLYVRTIMPTFLKTALNYQLIDNPLAAINIYQRFIEIILKYFDDREHIVSVFTQIALESENINNQIEMIIHIYDELCTFIYECPAKIIFKDDDIIALIIDRLRMLGDRFYKSIIPIHKKIIQILRYYCDKVNSEFDKQHYLKLIRYYYKKMAIIDTTSTIDSYSNLLEIYLNYDSTNFENIQSEIISLIEDRPKEMLEILIKVCINYVPLIRSIHRRLICVEKTNEPIPKCQSEYINSMIINYEKQSMNCLLSKNQEASGRCWQECICHLLDLQAKYDECIATCYLQIGGSTQAIRVFDPIIYTELAPLYCPQAYQRYIKFVVS